MATFSIKYALVGLTLGALTLVAANSLLPKTHLVRTEVILKRYNSSLSGDASELSKNRWVWVRDGLEISRRLQAVPLAAKILGQLNYTQVDSSSWPAANLKIDYTGGDENLYIFQVSSWDRDSAEKISQALVEELEKMGQEKIPANEKLGLSSPATEVIVPPTYLGNSLALKLKTIIFIIVLGSLMLGLLPLVVMNLRKARNL